MARYVFHNLTLDVRHEGEEIVEELAQLLHGLSFITTTAADREPSLCLSVRLGHQRVSVPSTAHIVFEADGFSGLESGEEFYLTDGHSLFHLQMAKGRGDAHLAPSFFAKPSLLQRNFWTFGLLKLLRPLGLYSLHAAGVVTKEGLGLLIIGESSSGKSTLALGLIRQGWSYLSDDAVLLRLHAEGVEALAFRKNFYIDASSAAAYVDLPLGEEALDAAGKQRRRVRVEDAYPGQYVSRCVPRVLLFSHIAPQAHSTVLVLDRLSALTQLLAGSGPQLFDRGTMAKHLEVLQRLMQQAAMYELRAGIDLYHQPLTLVRLLAEAEGEKQWPGL